MNQHRERERPPNWMQYVYMRALSLSHRMHFEVAAHSSALSSVRSLILFAKENLELEIKKEVVHCCTYHFKVFRVWAAAAAARPEWHDDKLQISYELHQFFLLRFFFFYSLARLQRVLNHFMNVMKMKNVDCDDCWDVEGEKAWDVLSIRFHIFCVFSLCVCNYMRGWNLSF